MTQIRVWLELDLDAEPIEGTLGPSDTPPTAFIGWLGLTEVPHQMGIAANAATDDAREDPFAA
jgi:hypothetical protein